jgi:hypothetical protein
VILEPPWWICAARAFSRGLRGPVGDLPEGCDDSAWRRLRDEWGLVWVIWRNRRSEPERARAIVAMNGRHASVHVLRSTAVAQAFLDRLGADAARAVVPTTSRDHERRTN